MSHQTPQPENQPSEFYKRALELTAHNLSILVRQNWQLWEMVRPQVPVHENGKDLIVQPDSATMGMIFEELGRRLEESALSAVNKDLTEIKNMLTAIWRNWEPPNLFPPSSEK